MSNAASKLDTEKFRKVHRLITAGATAGERGAAKARLEAMAKAAGITLDVALSSLDKPSTLEPTNFFAGFDDWMEKKEPGHKARETAKRAARNGREAFRRAEVLAAYGSERALFARNPEEAALEAAIVPLATWRYWTDDDGVEHRYAEMLDGKKPVCGIWGHADITPAIREAVTGAYPWPSNLDAALLEVKVWEQLRLDRGLFCQPGEWPHYAEVECRISLLEHELNAGRPAASWADVQARFDWKRYEFERQWIEPTVRDDPFLDRLEGDIADLAGVAQSAQFRHRTSADKRAAVLAMLEEAPDLADREIARRVGVSPQTVGTWRRKRCTTS